MSRARHAQARQGLRLFRKRKDDLLERSIRTCPGCDAEVHVFADVCRHCGGALKIFAA